MSPLELLIYNLGVWAGGARGGTDPQNFYGRAEICVIRAKIKISEKLCYVRKNFGMSAKITGYKGNFFGMSKIFFVCLRKVRDIREKFWVCPGFREKYFGDLPPPQHF